MSIYDVFFFISERYQSGPHHDWALDYGESQLGHLGHCLII